jgi:uncharacterized protein YqeY
MTLKEQIQAELRDAMRSGDERRKSTLRMVLASINNAEIPPSPDIDEEADEETRQAELAKIAQREELGDDAVLQVLRREVKQRRDSIDQFRKAARQDLIDKESAEIDILQAYLPQPMSRDAIAVEARTVIAETGAAGPADKGKVMPVLLKRLTGREFEGRTVNEVVTELLAAR